MFCGAALTFPGSGDGLLVVAMFRMVIALVAGVGRDSCAQVLRNSRLPPTGYFSCAVQQDLPKNGKCENYP